MLRRTLHPPLQGEGIGGLRPPHFGDADAKASAMSHRAKQNAIRGGVTPSRSGAPSPSPPSLPSRPAPFRAGLLHMSEEGQKEGVVPACAFDFETHGDFLWMRTDDVESHLSKD